MSEVIPGRSRLTNLDLNLLVPLEALLAERSVTRAAGRIGLSQPTLSTALARLRRHFGDDLLVRVGNSYELSPFAVDLLPRVRRLLLGVEEVFVGRADFVPEHSSRVFSVLASDYVIAVLGRALGAALREQAPEATLRLELLHDSFLLGAEQTLRGIDGVVLPHGFLAELPQRRLFTDRWVCLVSADNTEIGEEVTLERLVATPLVLSHWRSTSGHDPVIRQLTQAGLEPRVALVSESFLALPFLVSGTDRIGLLQARLADRLAEAAGVRILPCPVPTPDLVEAIWWHPVHDADPGHRWLRELVAEVAGRLGGL